MGQHLQIIDPTVAKLAKICGMLGSAHDGERAAAALKASQLLGDLDISWNELVMRAFTTLPQQPEIRYSRRYPGWHKYHCEQILRYYSNGLSEWDRDFLTSLAGKFGKLHLTEKQEAVLQRIAARFGINLN